MTDFENSTGLPQKGSDVEAARNLEKQALEKLAVNMTSGSMSLRSRGLDVTLVPVEYLVYKPDTQAETELKAEVETAPILEPSEFELSLRASQGNIKETKSGNLRYEPTFEIKIAGATKSIGLIDIEDSGFLAAGLGHETLTHAPKEIKAEIEDKWMRYIQYVEDQLNRDVDSKLTTQLALGHLKRYRETIDGYKGQKELEIADPNTDESHKKYSEGLREGYVAELSNIDRIVRALEGNNVPVKAKFGIVALKYGVYTVGLKISLDKPGPWGNVDSEE